MKKISYWFRYRKLLRGIADSKIFDGRGKGVDLYICDKCGERLYTRYEDKGVTPFSIACDSCKEGRMSHRENIASRDVPWDYNIRPWYRPTFKEMLELPEWLIEHVLNGGLILKGYEYGK